MTFSIRAACLKNGVNIPVLGVFYVGNADVAARMSGSKTATIHNSGQNFCTMRRAAISCARAIQRLRILTCTQSSQCGSASAFPRELRVN